MSLPIRPCPKCGHECHQVIVDEIVHEDGDESLIVEDVCYFCSARFDADGEEVLDEQAD